MPFGVLAPVDEILKHSFFLVVGAFFLFATVQQANPDNFWMSYYAKDIGLEVSALHAARGDVQIIYGKISAKHLYEYDLTKKSLLLRPYLEDGEAMRPWHVRKRFGMDLTNNGVKTTERRLSNPALLLLVKQGKEITMEETFTPLDLCSAPASPPLRAETLVDVAGTSPLVGSLSIIEQTFQPLRQPTTRITIAVNEGAEERIILEYSGSELTLAKQLSCEIHSKLSNFPIEERLGGGAPILPQEVLITIQHAAPPPGFEAKLPLALIGALDEVLR